jgi:hypothetical protein
MDGKELLYQLRQILNEDEDSGFLDTKTSYKYLNDAATEFVRRTNSLKASSTITIVADQKEYTLPSDFLNLYLKNEENRLYITYNDGSNNRFLLWRDYEDIIISDNLTSVSIPEGFTVIDDPTLDSRIESTATSTAAASNGESTLTDTAADFSDTNAGDIIHNLTDGSDGVVLSKTSSTELVTALFGGTGNDWTTGDSYVIQPQGRLQLVLDPPPSTAGHTITVHYLKRPNPVYSSFTAFRFQPQYMNALVHYAFFLYKYRDREPNFGDAAFRLWERDLRSGGHTLNKSFNRRRVAVNFKKRNR